MRILILGAAGMVGSGVELLVVPAGTLNHFSRDYAIPTELNAACALSTSTNVIEVDVARDDPGWVAYVGGGVQMVGEGWFEL